MPSALAGAGAVSAESLLPLVLGVNLGAAFPAISSTITETTSVRRIPIGNLLFRLAGVLVAIPLLGTGYSYLSSLDLPAGQQVIVFHLIFNASLCIAFIAITDRVAALLNWAMPAKPSTNANLGPRYLDAGLFDTPSLALGAAVRETLHMGEIVEEMLADTIHAFQGDDPALIEKISARENQVDELHKAIKLYVTGLMRNELDEAGSRQAVDLIVYTTDLEHVGDIIERNLMKLADKKRRQKLQFSDEGMTELKVFHERLMETLRLSLNVFMSSDIDGARNLVARKTQIRSLENEGTEQHIERLRSGQVESIVTSAIHLDVNPSFQANYLKPHIRRLSRARARR